MTPASRPIPENLWRLLFAVWTILIVLIGRQAFVANYDVTVGMAETAADSHFADEKAYRSWVLKHGGIYVHADDANPPNPLLAHIPDRDLLTSQGKRLTMVDASSLSRQVLKLTPHNDQVRVRLISLNPLRPENAPLTWERRALEQLRNGSARGKVLEVAEEGANGYRALRVVYPLKTTAACLECHRDEATQAGNLLGGLSVEVPLAPYHRAQAGTLAYTLFFCTLAWAAGVWLIALFRRYIETKLNQEARANHAVAVSERRFRTLFEEAAHGSAVVDLDSGLVLAANRALAGLTGRERSGLTARPLAALFTEQIALPQLLEAGGNRQPLHVRHADGGVRDVDLQAVRIELEGRPALYCALYDNTLRNLYLAETIRTSQMASIGELSAGVAHEINNPVGGVINYAQILLNRSSDEENGNQNELLRRIIKEGERIAAIVRSLLAFSRADGDRMDKVTLKKVVDEALMLAGGRLRRDGVEVEVMVPDELPPVRGNPQQLEQLVLNLLINARDALNSKFTEPGADAEKVVRLSASREGGYLRLEVYDNGSGVSEAQREKIFTPFFSTKAAERGTGLGLSICTEIVRRHGGRIELDSQKGEYSRFSVVLPQAGGSDCPAT